MDRPNHCSKRKMTPTRCSACGHILNEPPIKRRRVTVEEFEYETDCHSELSVFTMGAGDTGQLGLGPDEIEQGQPTIVDNLSSDIVQIAAGGLHSVCLTGNGTVLTFGLNDEGTLGRRTDQEEYCFTPAEVWFTHKIEQVSAGDSHTAAITRSGRLYIWGTFRDKEGNSSLTYDGPTKSYSPIEVMRGIVVVKVSSGADHILCLTDDELVYSFGTNEQGQLGRTLQQITSEENQPDPKQWLKPEMVSFPGPSLRFRNIWAGNYSSFAKSVAGDIYAWGLNNYYQLGFGDTNARPLPEIWPQTNEFTEWVEIAPGLHHTLALDYTGRVYSVGIGDCGQLGIGPLPPDSEKIIKTFGAIPKLQNVECVSIAAGTNSVSFAVTRNGTVYSWGMGCDQLGLGDQEDHNIYFPNPIGGVLRTRKALAVSAGGQHTIILANEPNSKQGCDVEGHVLRN